MERESLSDIFLVFAEKETRDYSPLYSELCRGIAGDSALLDMCAVRLPGQPQPNLILAASHYLLLAGAQHELRHYYASCTDNPRAPDGSFPAFRDFCLENEAAMRGLISSRMVQTNEVGRSACLLPAYAHVSRLADNRPLAMVDFGCSAGLNLLFDRFHYDYATAAWGNAASPVQLRSELRGDEVPSLVPGEPQVAYRIGLDLNPIDVRDEDELLWLRALVWPEHRARQEALLGAAALFRETPQRLLQGDGLELLPRVFAAIPADLPIVVYTSFVLYQLTPDQIARFESILADAAAQRALYYLSMGGNTLLSSIELVTWPGGGEKRETLLECAAHGQWLRWLAPAV